MGPSVIAVVLAASLLGWEGLWFLRRSVQNHHHRAWGLLLLVTAGWALLWARLFYLGRLVVSPDLGVVLVQGGALTRLGMILFLAGISLGAGLAWTACHEYPPERQLHHLAWRLGLAGGVAVLAAFQLRLLGLGEPELPPVYSYDLWSPPLLLWSCFCLAGCVLGLLRVRSLRSLFGLAALLISVLALFSLGRAEFTESPFARVWQQAWLACLILAFPFSLAFWTSRFLRELQTRWKWLGEGRYRALVVAAGGVGVGLVVLSQWGDGSLIWPSWVVLAGPLAVALTAAARRMKSVNLPGLTLPCRRIVLFSLLALPWVIAVPLFSSELEMLFGLAGVLLIAAVLAETLLDGPLRRGLRAWRSSISEASPDSGRLEPLRGWIARGGKGLKRGYDWLIARKPLRLILTTLPLALILLIAANEVPNAGKTIIQPFMVTGLATPRDREQAQELGQTLSEGLTGALGSLQRVLRSGVVLQQPVNNNKQMDQLGYAADMSGASSASAQNLVLEFGGGVKVPFRMLAAPIQAPVRALLGVKVIHGTLYEDQSRYILLARSSTGEAWQVELNKQPLSQELSSNPRSRVEPKLADAVSRLTRSLAFEIISADPRLADTSITRSWEAFESFRKGVERWDVSERTEDYVSLGQAIQSFREAIQADPGFTLAYYRLGLALQKEGQTDAAIKAFRTSILLNPGFVPGQVALASVFLEPGTTGAIQRTTVATSPRLSSWGSAKEDARRSEALRLWQRIIQVPGHPLEKTQAYYGLCLMGSDEARTEGRSDLDSQNRLRAYFYCKRAERMYWQLPHVWHAATALRESEAHVQGTLGRLLEQPSEDGDPRNACPLTNGEQPPPRKSPSWQTRPRLLQFRAASRYYQRAAELVEDPSQNISFRCSAARVAFLLGDEQPMAVLSKDASAHVLRADMYGDLVWSWEGIQYKRDRDEKISSAYRKALMEYEQAFNLDPTHAQALIRYAYNFWEWRFRYPEEQPPLGPTQEHGERAREFAQRASRLSSVMESRLREALALSALGEVLLGQARPGEAIPVLEDAVRLASDNAIFDELRWDLSQAYLCQAERLEKDGFHEGRSRVLRRKAGALLARIRQHDQEREDKIFSKDPAPTRAEKVCLEWKGSGSPRERKGA
ncbi:tetratricopeptide repeat protein [Archangium lipolyticum]|uniref:tetratricopeptide repeat protein n=1 Tax=Archangium lipolyticum TaxID=2970465 RepID=UPI002149E766|nr:tetratricopeptide repeat protein [Archangium lipolyticum]